MAELRNGRQVVKSTAYHYEVREDVCSRISKNRTVCKAETNIAYLLFVAPVAEGLELLYASTTFFHIRAQVDSARITWNRISHMKRCPVSISYSTFDNLGHAFIRSK